MRKNKSPAAANHRAEIQNDLNADRGHRSTANGNTLLEPAPPESSPPRALQVRSNNIPEALRALDQWVLWRYELRRDTQRGDADWTKVPYQPDGRHASSTDARTWSPFELVLKHYRAGEWDGVGFVVAEDDGIVGVDLDHCRDPKTGKIEPWAQEVVNNLDSYSELSPSGTGIRIFVKARFRSHVNRKGNLEIYSAARYLTVTGNMLDGDLTPVRSRERELEAVATQYLGAGRELSSAPKNSSGQAQDGSGQAPNGYWVSARLRAHQRGSDHFATLYRGEWQGVYPSQSEADFALCGHLLKITDGDRELADGLFRASGLYRDKWEREDYRNRTLERAAENQARPEADVERLAGAREVVDGLDKRLEVNVAAAFEPEVVDALAVLHEHDLGTWTRATLILKKHDVRMRDVQQAIAEAERRSSTGSSAAPKFQLTDDAVLYVESDPHEKPLEICGPLEVVALTRDARGDGWGRLLEWRDAEGQVHHWAMPMSLLSGDGGEYRARLLDGGLIISPGRGTRELLTTYIQTARPAARARCASRIGWHGGAFVLPDKTIGTDGEEQVLYQTPYEADHYWNESGTAVEWREHVGRLCRGNSRLILAVSCAFAGPILSIVGAESGGIHLYGLSSTGKTTAAMVGGSVCGGGGKHGFLQSWRTTINGLEAVAEAHSDGALFLDELSQADAREAAQTAYLLGNGQGKGRMTKSIGMRRRATWALLYFSTGEMTLAEHAASVGNRTRGGAEVRLLSIVADAGAGLGVFEDIHGAKSPAAFSKRLKNLSKRFYGAPFRAFLERLTEDGEGISRFFRAMQDSFAELVPSDATGEVWRAADTFALIAVAGEMASGYGLTGWQRCEALFAAKRCFEEWLKQRETTGSSDIEAAIRQVRAFIEANGTSRFQEIHYNREEASAIRDRAGFCRYNRRTGETHYWFLQEVFKTEVCKGYSATMVLNALEERGYLVRQAPHWTVKPGRLPGMPKGMRVFCVRAAILRGSESPASSKVLGTSGDSGEAQ